MNAPTPNLATALDGVDLRLKGRQTQPISATLLGPLTEVDVALLGEERATKPSPLKKLRARHHQLARNLAEGMSVAQAAGVNGYTVSSVSVLQGDHAFQELVSFYQQKIMEQFVDAHKLAASVSTNALMIIQERQEEDPDSMSTGLLLETAVKLMDRTGFGPTSNQNINVNVGFAAKLEEARKRAQTAKPFLDLSPNEPDLNRGTE